MTSEGPGLLALWPEARQGRRGVARGGEAAFFEGRPMTPTDRTSPTEIGSLAVLETASLGLAGRLLPQAEGGLWPPPLAQPPWCAEGASASTCTSRMHVCLQSPLSHGQSRWTRACPGDLPTSVATRPRLRCRGPGLQHMHFGGGTIQLMTDGTLGSRGPG